MKKKNEVTVKIYNSFSNKIEIFYPIKKGEIKIYSCGPTVYDYAHIGNYRSFLFSDFIHRFFKFMGYQVKMVMNLTDIDDKTIKGAIEKKVSLNTYTETFCKAFFEDIASLGFLKDKIYPRATDNISEMIRMIETLIDKGLAYVSNGSVYFSIKNFSNYGKLSNLNLAEIKIGEKNLNDEYAKESIADFVLWKAFRSEEGDNYYDSPWGPGRPGWHIECSAMSKKFLGEHFDIHTGGIDNRFPHHENEIAQSEGANDSKFVNYWMHVSHLLVENEKMSKSLGNFYTLKELLAKGYSPISIRYMFLSTHYRSHYNFTIAGIKAATTTLQRVDRFIRLIKEKKVALAQQGKNNSFPPVLEFIMKKEISFREYLANDFNVSAGLADFFDVIAYVNRAIDQLGLVELDRVLDFVQQVDEVFGCFIKNELESEGDKVVPDAIKRLVEKRVLAKKNKDYALADQLRNEVEKSGYIIEDRAEGSRVLAK